MTWGGPGAVPGERQASPAASRTGCREGVGLVYGILWLSWKADLGLQGGGAQLCPEPQADPEE